MIAAAASRRQQERLAREALMLDHAQRLLVAHGFQSFNLDDLAHAIGYAKGTIYLHFESKEDLALAVANRALKERADLFERAARFAGGTRERMHAIGVACCQFAVAYPEYFHAEMMLKSQSFWQKATERRRHQHSLEAARCFRTCHQVVQEAMRVGDLPPAPMSSEQVTFAFIAVTVGSHIMAREPDLHLLAGIADPIQAVRQNQELTADGLGWQPLFRDHDFAATDRRIRREIFPEAGWLPA